MYPQSAYLFTNWIAMEDITGLEHELGKRGTSSSFYQEPTPIARNPLLGDSINPFERAEPS
jgi:hypothetical protein